MKFKESDYWLTAVVAGVVSTMLAAFFGSYDDFRYGALFSVAVTNAYRISRIEQDHEPEPPFDAGPFEHKRWDGRTE